MQCLGRVGAAPDAATRNAEGYGVDVPFVGVVGVGADVVGVPVTDVFEVVPAEGFGEVGLGG